jgi:hypothetical protein
MCNSFFFNILTTAHSFGNRDYRNPRFRKYRVMAKLPDLEGLAIFAKVAECRSFADAPVELGLTKATPGSELDRLSARLAALNCLMPDDSWWTALPISLPRVKQPSTQAQARTPRGLVRLAAPVSSVCCTWLRSCRSFLLRFPRYRSICV